MLTADLKHYYPPAKPRGRLYSASHQPQIAMKPSYSVWLCEYIGTHIYLCCGPIMWYNDVCSRNKQSDLRKQAFDNHNIAIVQCFGLIFMQAQGFTNVHSGEINQKQE